MNSDDPSHRLILGLKNGLMEADREIRTLKDKLFKYILREMDLKTKLGDLRINSDEILQNKQQEIDTLRKDFRDVENKNLNMSFQLKQLRAFSEEKVKEVESLKSENLRKTKMLQKEEARSKCKTLPSANKKLTTKLPLSASELLFIDELAFDNVVEGVLQEMTKPLKPQSEINDLWKFHEELVSTQDTEFEGSRERKSKKSNTVFNELSVLPESPSRTGIEDLKLFANETNPSIEANNFNIIFSLDKISSGNKTTTISEVAPKMSRIQKLSKSELDDQIPTFDSSLESQNSDRSQSEVLIESANGSKLEVMQFSVGMSSHLFGVLPGTEITAKGEAVLEDSDVRESHELIAKTETGSTPNTSLLRLNLAQEVSHDVERHIDVSDATLKSTSVLALPLLDEISSEKEIITVSVTPLEVSSNQEEISKSKTNMQIPILVSRPISDNLKENGSKFDPVQSDVDLNYLLDGVSFNKKNVTKRVVAMEESHSQELSKSITKTNKQVSRPKSPSLPQTLVQKVSSHEPCSLSSESESTTFTPLSFQDLPHLNDASSGKEIVAINKTAFEAETVPDGKSKSKMDLQIPLRNSQLKSQILRESVSECYEAPANGSELNMRRFEGEVDVCSRIISCQNEESLSKRVPLKESNSRESSKSTSRMKKSGSPRKFPSIPLNLKRKVFLDRKPCMDESETTFIPIKVRTLPFLDKTLIEKKSMVVQETAFQASVERPKSKTGMQVPIPDVRPIPQCLKKNVMDSRKGPSYGSELEVMQSDVQVCHRGITHADKRKTKKKFPLEISSLAMLSESTEEKVKNVSILAPSPAPVTLNRNVMRGSEPNPNKSETVERTSLSVELLAFLDEISIAYHRFRKEQPLLEEFAMSLNSESCKDKVDNIGYVVVFQATDSNCETKAQQLDLREEILNDWIVTDSLNEVDLDYEITKSQEITESEDCHVLEYTSASPSNEEDILCLGNSAKRIYLEATDNRANNVLCWMNENHDFERGKERTQREEKVKESKLGMRVGEIIASGSEDSEPDLPQGNQRESEEVEITLGDGRSIDRIPPMELIPAEDEESELDTDETNLVIVDDVIESETQDRELIVEDEVIERVSGIAEILEDENYMPTIRKTDQWAGVLVSSAKEETRYNLRRKLPLNYAFLDKGSASRKRTLNSDVSLVRKVFKSDFSELAISSTNEASQISAVLFQHDTNKHSDIETNENKPCLPKFYVENPVSTDRSCLLPEKSPFELAWSIIRNLEVDDSSITSSQESTLVYCGDSVVRAAFEFNSEKTRNANTRSERIMNMNGVKRFIEEYLREKKSLSKIAMANLIASVGLSNRTTICCAVESVLLHPSKSECKKPGVVYDSLMCVCMEIDRKVFDGFVDAMKTHLKEKMFAKTFRVDDNSNRLSMISSTIVQSRFYTILCQATRNANDAINLLHESLMSLKNRAHPIAFGVLSQWPDILKHQPRQKLFCDIMLFCLVHHKMIYNSSMYKVTEVQELIGQNYGIKLGEKTAEEYARDTITSICSNDWVDAIVLLCKRQMFSWTYTNVIMKYLIPLLRVWQTDIVKEVVLLRTTQALRRIMLSCPYDKEELNNYNFDAIVKTLTSVLHNNEMSSRELKETVCLAICELSSRRFPLCFESLSSWLPPDRKLSSRVLSQMHDFMRKKVNYQKWAAFLTSGNSRRRFPFRKNEKKESYDESGGKKISEQKGVISVGITRSSRAQAMLQKTEVKKSKTKKKKKKKNRKQK